MDLSRLKAVALGATAGFSWAAAFMVSATAVLRAAGAREPFHGGPLGSFAFLGFFAPRATDEGRWFWFWPAAALAGALVGLTARYLRRGRAFRLVVLWVTFFPAVAISTAVEMWLVGLVANLRGESFFPFWRDLVALPGALVVFSYGTFLVSPVLAWPLLAAAATVEAWTRPPVAGDASHSTTRALVVVLAALAVVVLASLAYLRLSWSETLGGTWLAP